MLVTDVGDKIFWRQLLDANDGFGHFGLQTPLSPFISVLHQYSKYITNIQRSSPILRRQNHDVTYMTVTDLFQLSKFIFCKKSSKSIELIRHGQIL